MPASELEVANQALVLLKRGTIRSLEGNDPRATAMSAFFQMAKELVIEEYDWPQCRVIKALTAVSLPDTDLRGWVYAYAIPSDVVFLWEVNTLRNTKVTKYEIGMSSDLSSDTNYIFADDPDLAIRYGSRRVSIARFTPKTARLIAVKLAEMTCMELTKDVRLWLELKKTYVTEASEVKTRIANVEPEVVDVDFTPELISVRSS